VGLVVTDLLAGRMDAQITNLPAQIDNVRSGKLRALGVTSAKRSARLPEVPAIAETVPGFDVMVWYGVCAPAKVVQGIVKKVAADVAQAITTPEVQKRMADLGVDVEVMGPERFSAYIKAETVKWAKVVKTAGIATQ
jgi:tripartite-type tricarboxylate transporter receptor subunit TctC